MLSLVVGFAAAAAAAGDAIDHDRPGMLMVLMRPPSLEPFDA